MSAYRCQAVCISISSNHHRSSTNLFHRSGLTSRGQSISKGQQQLFSLSITSTHLHCVQGCGAGDVQMSFLRSIRQPVPGDSANRGTSRRLGGRRKREAQPLSCLPAVPNGITRAMSHFTPTLHSIAFLSPSQGSDQQLHKPLLQAPQPQSSCSRPPPSPLWEAAASRIDLWLSSRGLFPLFQSSTSCEVHSHVNPLPWNAYCDLCSWVHPN